MVVKALAPIGFLIAGAEAKASQEAGGWVVGLLTGAAVGVGVAIAGVPAGIAAILAIGSGLLADYCFSNDVSKSILNLTLKGIGSLGFDLSAVRSALPAINAPQGLQDLSFTQAPAGTRRNPTIFDLTVNPTNLKPVNNRGLGGTSGDVGLLMSGVSFQAVMDKGFVNKGALSAWATCCAARSLETRLLEYQMPPLTPARSKAANAGATNLRISTDFPLLNSALG